MNILFFHGLDSSAKTNKFTVIEKKNKFSVTVDYRKLSFHEVGLLYDKLIAKSEFMENLSSQTIEDGSNE